MGLHLETKIKSNRCLDIGTGEYDVKSKLHSHPPK